LCIGAGVTGQLIGMWDELLNAVTTIRVGDTLVNHWSQIKIAEVLLSHKTLCIGFSGTDSNFRYLTRMMRQNEQKSLVRNKSAVWLTKQFSQSFYSKSENGDPYAFAFLQALSDSADTYYKDGFGVNILWAKNFNDMADKLECISKRYSNK
jgi:hypothetical protein